MVYFFKRYAFVHRNVVSLIAFDFILWIILVRVMYIALVDNIFFVHFDNFSADVPGLRVPRHVIADFEFVSHGVSISAWFLPANNVSFTNSADAKLDYMRFVQFFHGAYFQYN